MARLEDELALWFAMGSPENPTDEKYGWLPDLNFDLPEVYPGDLTQSKNVTRAVISAQFEHYYKPELDFLTSPYEGELTPKMAIYGSLYRRTHKLPHEATPMDVLDEVYAGAFLKGYSGHSVDNWYRFIDTHGVHSVYDPCAGWGQRLLSSGFKHVHYLGVDINSALFDGYAKLIQTYDLKNVGVIRADSAKVPMMGAVHDTVYTCPPYGSHEIYTPYGAENLSTEAFYVWWRQVVYNAVSGDTHWFVYQIDDEHAERMDAAICDRGFELKDVWPVKKNPVSKYVRPQLQLPIHEETFRIFERI